MKSRVMVFAMICVGLFAAKCHDGCVPEEMMCEDGSVMICNGDKDWEKSLDCESISMVCCNDPADGMPSCLPVDLCNADMVAEGEK